MIEILQHGDGRVDRKSLDDIESSPLYHHDLAPGPATRRHQTNTYYAAIWS